MIYRSKSPIPVHGVRLIAVPDELLSEPISSYTEIMHEDKRYKVYSEIVHTKGEQWSSALPLLSAGVHFSEQKVFEKYANSERIIFFLCEEINN